MNRTTSLPPAHASDAEFRSWGSWISASFAAFGWVQSADSGQVNWTTVTRASTNTAAGYEIWAMDDSLQGTKPVLVKIEYGTGASTGFERIWITVGATSDGSGTLTGTTSTRLAVGNNSGSATAMTWVASGDANRIMLAANVYHASTVSSAYPFMFCIERTHDGAGLDTEAGALIVCSSPTGMGNNATMQQQYWPWNATPAAVEGLGFFGPAIGTGSDGTSIMVYPIYICKGGPYVSPPTGVMGIMSDDFAPSTTVTLPVYGSNRDYYVPSPSDVNNMSRSATANGNSLVVRYD